MPISAAFSTCSGVPPITPHSAPAYVEIVHATLDGSPAQVSVEGPSGTTNGLALGDMRFVLRYPLLATGPTPVTLRRSGMPGAHGSSVGVFASFSLRASNERLVRPVDRLLAGRREELDNSLLDG